MASSKVLVLSFVICSVLAIGLQISGLLTPGWLVYKTDVTEVETLPLIYQQMILFQRDDQPQALPLQSNSPQDLDTKSSEEFKDVDPRPWGGPKPRPPPHHRHHPLPSDGTNQQNPVNSPVIGVEEDLEIDQMQEVKIEVSAHIGLWFARGCLHVDTESESGGDKKKGRCNCTTVSMDDAMKLVNTDPQVTSMDKQRKRSAYMFLNKMRIEAAIGSMLVIIGFVVGLVALKKDSRPVVFIPVVFIASAMMLTSCILVFIPVLRIGMANHEMKKGMDMVNKMSEEDNASIKITGKIGCPYSLVLSGSGMIAAFIACLILSISSCVKSRRNAQSSWTRFYNEYAGESGAKISPSKEKCPELTLHFGEEAEPLPEKVALA